MGDEASLGGLLAHADRYMTPSWADGGLYYPRNDTVADEDGNRVLVEPMTGNVLLGYARLNVPDGLWGLYNEPWSPDHFVEPALVAIGDNVDVGRAVFDAKTRALHFSVRCRGDDAASNTVVIGNLPADGSWKVRCDREEFRFPTDQDVGRYGEIELRRETRGVALRFPAGKMHDFVLTI